MKSYTEATRMAMGLLRICRFVRLPNLEDAADLCLKRYRQSAGVDGLSNPDDPDHLSVLMERYAIYDSCVEHRTVTVSWGDTMTEQHVLDLRTGQCIQSQRGTMRGFVLHPADLSKFRKHRWDMIRSQRPTK